MIVYFFVFSLAHLLFLPFLIVIFHSYYYSHIFLYYGDMLPPLKSLILKWGFLLNGSTDPSIYKLSSRAPRFFYPDTGMFSYYLIVQKTTTAKCFAKKYLLFFCRIDPETICYVQYFFSPWVSMYWLITSTGAPATGTFISIDKFTKFCSQLRTEHYMHMINVMVLLYHRPHYRTSVLFVFMQFISHL